MTPPVEPPTEWVYTWLESKGLARLASPLIDAGFADEADLALEPRLDLHALGQLGIEKPADQRRLMGLIKAL